MTWRDIFRCNRDKEIPQYNLAINDIKQKANILFLDDEEVELISLLRREGWHIEHWTEIVSLNDLEEGKFDLIFLDIGGVGTQYSPIDEGFGILKRIKSKNPSVLIVAYSGQSFDASKSEFWSLADDNLSKTSGALKAIGVLEELLKEKFNSQYLWNELEDFLKKQNIEDSKINKIKKQIIKNNSSDAIKSTLQKYLGHETSISISLNIITKILTILQFYSN